MQTSFLFLVLLNHCFAAKMTSTVPQYFKKSHWLVDSIFCKRGSIIRLKNLSYGTSIIFVGNPINNITYLFQNSHCSALLPLRTWVPNGTSLFLTIPLTTELLPVQDASIGPLPQLFGSGKCRHICSVLINH